MGGAMEEVVVFSLVSISTTPLPGPSAQAMLGEPLSCPAVLNVVVFRQDSPLTCRPQPWNRPARAWQPGRGPVCAGLGKRSHSLLPFCFPLATLLGPTPAVKGCQNQVPSLC